MIAYHTINKFNSKREKISLSENESAYLELDKNRSFKFFSSSGLGPVYTRRTLTGVKLNNN